jgi:hypothetical protein
MSVSREQTTVPAGVSFEVDRFAWVDGRLEVTGRWYGIRGRRFLRPTLDVEVDGSPRRMLAVLEHKPWAADDGEEWMAAFEWNGDPVALAVAELAVAPELSVVLPPPTGAPAKKPRRAKAAGERLAAAPPRAQALEAALAEAQAEASVLRDRLIAEQKAWQQRVEEVEALRDENASARSAAEAERDEAAAARNAAISEREELISTRDAAVEERNAAVAAADAARADAEKAAAERDKAVREKAALETELAATARARDKARAERNEWLTRAREGQAAAAAERGADPAERHSPPDARHAAPTERQAAPAERREAAPEPEAPTAPLPKHGLAPAPSPPNKPRKEQIPPGGILLPPTGPGSHMRRSMLPGWAPRVLAPILLVVLVVVIALLIGWAL